MTSETINLGQLVPTSHTHPAVPPSNSLSSSLIVHTLFKAAKEGLLSQTGIKGPDAGTSNIDLKEAGLSEVRLFFADHIHRRDESRSREAAKAAYPSSQQSSHLNVRAR